jgi:hypothetical protein
MNYSSQGFLLCYIKQDEFASLPAIVPKGPIAILGLVNS